jgi:PAS domain S-box-containing protein
MAHAPSLEADSSAVDLLSVLAELAADGSPAPSPLEAARRVLRRGVAALGATGGVACIVDSRGETVDVVEGGATGSVPEAAVAATAAVAGAHPHEAWLSTSAEIRARFGSSATRGPGALAAVRAVAAGEQGAGGLALWFDEERAFPHRERAFLATLGRMLAQEVERASLLAQQRAEVRERAKMTRWAEVLGEAFRLLSSHESLPRILDELARISCETPADISAIRVLSPDRRSLEYRAVYHRDPAQAESLRAALADRAMPADLGETARVLEEGISLLLPVVDMEKILRAYGGTPFGEYVRHHPVSTVMVVPLRSRGSVFGVVTIARVAPEPFQPADLRFLAEVADRAAAALDNTNLLQKLGRSEEQLRVALEAGRLGAWDWDIPQGKVTWSTMLERIHGLDPGGFGGSFDAYQRDIHPDDRERVLATIARAVEERTDHHIVYRIVRPDGEARWLEAHGRLICNPAGTPQRLVGVCEDVTEQRRSEEQLRQMVLALRDADQRKDQFLAMLAHELRNPLGPMLNATYLLRIPDLDADAAAHAREILDRQVRHMARLLDDLLDVSRITRGKIDLVREPVDVTALTREVVGDHLHSFHAAGLTVDVALSVESLFVYADRARLAQIIGNLLSNALKFSHSGQSVRVRVARQTGAQSMVLTVRDEGAGIEPAMLDTIFEPFVQADTSLSRARGGLGLGLAVVKGLVALHGGCVSASSDGPGRGAELRVEIPLHAAEREAAPASPPEPGPSRGPVATVLLFEDNADAAESLRVVLCAAGYRVCVEATGRDATTVVKRVQPAIVLCDLGLPDRDGYGIAADIRSDSELAPLPLIAISGYGAADDQARSRQAGFDLHLTKPVPPALLLAELSHRIGRAAPVDERRAQEA